MAYRLVPPPEAFPDGIDYEREVIEKDQPDFLAAMTVSKAKTRKEDQDALLLNYKLLIVQNATNGLYTENSRRAYLEGISGKEFQLSNGKTVHYSVKTMERWIRDYRESGCNPDSLKTKTRKDKGESRKLTQEIIDKIKEYLGDAPTARATDIHEKLVEEHMIAKDDVCVETIRRLIRNSQLRIRIAETETGRIRHSFIFKEAGQLWEADTCYFLKIWAGRMNKWVYIQGIMDNHSRFIVAAKCWLADTAENFRKTLMDAILHHHIPTLLYLDNGAPYIDKLLLEICAKLGIAVVHTRSKDGAAKGAIERWWYTLECHTILDIAREKPDTLEAVQQLVDKWVVKYHLSVNKGIEAKPLDRLTASLKRHVVRKAQSKEWLTDIFLHEACPVVHRDTTIQVAKIHFRVPDELAHQKKLTVRYDPDHPRETIYAVFEDRKYYLKEDDREANAYERRNRGGRQAELKEREEARKKKAQEQEQKIIDEGLNTEIEKTMTLEAMELLKQAEQAVSGDDGTDYKTLEETRAEARYSRRMAGSVILQESQNPDRASTPGLTLDLANL